MKLNELFFRTYIGQYRKGVRHDIVTACLDILADTIKGYKICYMDRTPAIVLDDSKFNILVFPDNTEIILEHFILSRDSKNKMQEVLYMLDRCKVRHSELYLGNDKKIWAFNTECWPIHAIFQLYLTSFCDKSDIFAKIASTQSDWNIDGNNFETADVDEVREWISSFDLPFILPNY